MKNIVRSFTRNFINNQKGQILPWVGFLTVGLFGVGGLSVDLGRAYVASAQLQSYANASALSAAGRLTTSSATTYANTYSASGGDKNANSNLGTVTTTVSTMCANVLMPSGSTCSSSSTANAIKVTQTATVATTFLRLFGTDSLTISSSAMASMQGAAQPWNVAIVLDGTGSMTQAGSANATSCSGFSSNFDCALNGVKTLLSNVNSQGNFRVALFSFPNVSTATVSGDWTCSGTPTNAQYTFPATDLSASTGYEPLTYSGSPASATTYENTPTSGLFSSQDGDANGFVGDYYSATASNHLNSSSSIVKAVTGCLKNPGGEGTYYGGVLYAAQAALLAEKKANPGSKNALIVLSDGQAQAASTNLASGSPTGTYSSDGSSVLSSPSGSNFYPSATNECQQAIAAAQAAQSAGTTIYSLAFGSEASGCTTSSGGKDSSIYATATSGQPALSLSTLTPCIVMKNMASPSGSDGTTYFYADSSSSSNGCTDLAHAITNISDIFFAISGDFTTPRLLPTSSQDVVLTTAN